MKNFKKFFDGYAAIPFAILLFIFFAPTVMVGGFMFASYVFGVLPDTALCEKVEKK